MSAALFILAVTLAVLSAVLLGYWAVVAWHIARTMLQVPMARAGIALANADPPRSSVAIVIPAHNEERVLPLLIASLRQLDYPAFHVVLALDRCTDASVRVSREAIGDDPRFQIVEISACPEGWAGKVNAVWTGLRASTAAPTADYLVFADADTLFDRDGLRAFVALARHRRLDLLSLLSTLTHDRWFERLAQPAAGMELMRQYPIIRANRDERRRAFANGQFMMFRREAYDQIGGHASVREALLEDLALARAVHHHGLRPGVFLADGLLTCRMYPTWPAFRKGWKRIYTEAANRKAARLRRSALQVMIFGSWLPLASVAGLILLALPDAREFAGRDAMLVVSGAALLIYFAVSAWTYHVGRSPLWAVPGHPVGSWLVSRILREAARDLDTGRPTEWGGRQYTREGR